MKQKMRKLSKTEEYYISMLHFAWQMYMLGAKQKITESLQDNREHLIDVYDKLVYFDAIAHEIAGPDATEEEVADTFLENVPKLISEVDGDSYDDLQPVEKRKNIALCVAYMETKGLSRMMLNA
jgi:hypothetical protein